jgi:hypothetical protein
MAMSEYSETLLHSHAWLSCAFRSTGVSEIDCQPKIHGQTDRIFGRHVIARRTTGCSFAHHELSQKVTAAFIIPQLILIDFLSPSLISVT